MSTNKCKAKARAYSQGELHACLHACRTPTERAIVIMLAQTAARRGGVCTLRRQNMEGHYVTPPFLAMAPGQARGGSP